LINPDTSGNLWPRVTTKMYKKMISSQYSKVSVMIKFARHSRKKNVLTPSVSLNLNIKQD